MSAQIYSLTTAENILFLSRISEETYKYLNVAPSSVHMYTLEMILQKKFEDAFGFLNLHLPAIICLVHEISIMKKLNL